MIKRSLKNYLVCLKYILIPLGTLFLGLIIGLSLFVPIAGTALNELITETKAVLDEVSVEPQALFSQIYESALELDWSNPARALITVVSPEWLEEALHGGIAAVFGGDEAISSYTAQITSSVDSAAVSVQAGFSTLISFAALGILAGYFILKFMIRKEIASRSVWKVLLAGIVNFLVVSALTVLSVWLASLWAFSLIFTVIAIFLAVGGMALVEAYVIHGLNKVKFKEVFTLKNVFLLAVSNLILFLIWLAVTALITFLLNAIAGIIIGLTLFELTSIVINMNAEAYVKDYADNR